MSLGRPDKPGGDIRDVAADYLNAHIAEYTSYKTAGNTERAAEVAAVLKQLGHEVEPKKAPPKEKAIPANTLEKAVESDVPPSRPVTTE